MMRAGVLAPLRPDKYLRMAAAARGGLSVTLGLANYKVRRELRVLDELPRNATGKIIRSELRALAGG
jgi:acyl-coenzyme A synthetase/AMP-(fatty) acid ligase